MTDPPIAAFLAALVIAMIIVLAVRRPATRRWIAAGFALAAGLLVAFYVVVLGALAQVDAGEGIRPVVIIVAVAAAGAGLALAIWVLRSGRRDEAEVR